MCWSDSNPMNGVPTYTDSALLDPNYIASMQNCVPCANGQELRTEQVPSRQLVRRNNNHVAERDYGGYGHLPGQNEWTNEDEEDLEAQVLKARKEAQAKRNRIPKLVQKLSSLLDNSNHTDLIRWSDNGNSFIVIDGDEYAKISIAKLFKYKNYSSFARQLHTYCFHKKVRLLDNSMKQAERRHKKTPTEYFHKYFKRGRPELLWLIQKPQKPRAKAKRKRDDNKKHNSDDEGRKYNPDAHDAHDSEDGGNQDMQLIPKADYNGVRNEIGDLQQSPGPQPKNRPPAFLTPPTAREAQPASLRFSTQSTSSRPTVSNKEQQGSQIFYMQQQQQQEQQQGPRNLSTNPQTALEHNLSAIPSPAVKSETPPVLQILQNSDDMMAVINLVSPNSSSITIGPQSKFPAALSHYHPADGNTPLMQQQRDDRLSLMNHAAFPSMNGDIANGASNALANPETAPMSPVENFGHHQEQLDGVHMLQKEQATRLESLSECLAPTSPSGMIPGLDQYASKYGNQSNAPPSDFDFDSFINTGTENYFTDPAPATTVGATVDDFTTLSNNNNMDFYFGNFDDANFFPTNEGQQNPVWYR